MRTLLPLMLALLFVAAACSKKPEAPLPSANPPPVSTPQSPSQSTAPSGNPAEPPTGGTGAGGTNSTSAGSPASARAQPPECDMSGVDMSKLTAEEAERRQKDCERAKAATAP